MTRTFHARAFIALPPTTDPMPDYRTEVAVLYINSGVTGVTITEGVGYTAEWGLEDTIIVEAFGRADSAIQVAFYRATINALKALNQQSALLHEEVLTPRGGVMNAAAALINADGTRTELS